MERLITFLEENIDRYQSILEDNKTKRKKEETAVWVRKNECEKILSKIRALLSESVPANNKSLEVADLISRWETYKEESFRNYCSGKSRKELEKIYRRCRKIMDNNENNKQIQFLGNLYLIIIAEFFQSCIAD